MKKTIAILALAAVGLTTVHAGVHVGINFGLPLPVPALVAPAPIALQPPIPAPIVEATPACPVPGYVWVGGNWAWCDNHWVWTRGHWGAPAHWDHNARWVRNGHWGHGYRPEHRESFHAGYDREHGHR